MPRPTKRKDLSEDLQLDTSLPNLREDGGIGPQSATLDDDLPAAARNASNQRWINPGLSKETLPGYAAPQPSQKAAVAVLMPDSFIVPSYFVRNRIPYMLLPDAARLTGVNRETLLNWMKKKIEFDGEPIDGFYFKPTGNHYISQPSVKRIANRFIEWPSEIPAGPVVIGKRADKSGYLPTSEAAQIIGIADPTLRHWVRLNKGPLDQPLDAVKCTTSGYFYIQHKDVLRLAEHVRDHGIPRGRRAQPAPQL